MYKIYIKLLQRLKIINKHDFSHYAKNKKKNLLEIIINLKKDRKLKFYHFHKKFLLLIFHH